MGAGAGAEASAAAAVGATASADDAPGRDAAGSGFVTLRGPEPLGGDSGDESGGDGEALVDENKFTYLRKGRVVWRNADGSLGGLDSSDGSEDGDSDSDGDGSGASGDGEHAEYDGAEATLLYRKTALDVLTEESEKLGRVPDGIRFRAGHHRNRRGGKGKATTVRDAVRSAAVEKEKRGLRVKAGNQQKGRERRKLQDAAREAAE